MKKITLFLLILCSTLHAFTQTGPGGVGTDDGTSNLVLWLKHDAGVEEASGDAAEANDDVEFWRDQSGYGNDLSQTTIGDRPMFNGSAIEFRGAATSNTTGEYMDLTAISAQTIIIVTENISGNIHGLFSQPYSGGSSVYLHVHGSETIVSFDGDNTTEEGVYALNGENLSASADNHSGTFPSGETLLYAEYNNQQSGFDQFGCLSNNVVSNGYRANIDIKEVIVYDDALTDCERAKVETYLSAKYNIDFNYYTAPSVNYQNAIVELFYGGAGVYNSFDSSGILTIEDVSFFTDFSDGIGFGNNGIGGTSSDVPGGLDFRVGTIWYIDYKSCDGNNGDIKLKFKLDGGDCGISTPSNAANYRLLHHNATTMSGATAVSGGVINGSYIEFTISTTTIGGRYVSLATTDVTTSTLGVTGPANISTGLTLWLKSDCGLEEAIGDAAEASDAVYRWKDQSGSGNHAIQTTSGDQPVYNGTTIQFTGDATSNTTGEYMELNPFEGQTIIAVLDNVADGPGGGIHGVLGQSASSSYSDLFISTEHTYAASFDGDIGETGALGISGTELTSDGGNVGSAEFPDSLTVAYFEYTSNQDDIQYLGGFTRTGTDVTHRANYDLQELIVFNRDLTCDERADIEAYLANKYSANMVYNHSENIGDNGINTSVLLVEENNTSGISSTALTVSDVDFINDCIDTLWIAHDGATGITLKANDADMSGLAGTDVIRWTRIWYAVHASNDLTPDDVTLVFDLDNYVGSTGATVAGANYRLITSASPWSYATVVSGPTINVGNNTVSFTVDVDVVKNKKFTLATTDEAISPLPVELISFDAVKESEAVRISWSTASELNNDYFTVERSINTRNWEMVKQIDGAGNANSLLSYATIDETPYEGLSYYRLKQTDFNGQYTYSNVIPVNFETTGTTNIYPNPTTDKVTMLGNGSELDDIIIYNILGQNVTERVIVIKMNNNTIEIDLSKLNTGTYYIKTKTTANKVHKK